MTRLLHKLFSRLFKSTPTPFRRRKCLVVEALEDRCCPAVLVEYLAESHTLNIVGDPNDNAIIVQNDAADNGAIIVQCDGRDFGSFREVDRVVIQTGAGNDHVLLNFTRPTNTHFPTDQLPAEFHIDTGAGNDVVDFSAVETFPHLRLLNINTGNGGDDVGIHIVRPGETELPAEFVPAEFRVATGAGNDRVLATVGDPAGVADPAVGDPIALFIDTGAGDDVVDVNINATFPYLAIALGNGNDRLNVTVADPAVGDPGEVDPPEPDRQAEIHIDAGRGDDVVVVDVLRGAALLDIDMGKGNDLLRVEVGDPTEIGETRG